MAYLGILWIHAYIYGRRNSTIITTGSGVSAYSTVVGPSDLPSVIKLAILQKVQEKGDTRKLFFLTYTLKTMDKVRREHIPIEE